MLSNTQMIHIDLLQVNPNNDRHGEVTNEANAIKTLLDSLPGKMKKLAKDIAQTGQLFMMPMVSPTTPPLHLVHDGNRRVTCLKLLQNPHHAPTEEWQFFFSKVAKEAKAELPKEVNCLISTDQDWIDDYLYRIHTGSQDGVGQINWDNPAKAHFVERTGKSSKINIPGLIQEKLISGGYIDDSLNFKHTNLKRLLSSEEFRSRVGISSKNNNLVFTRDIQKSLQALSAIVHDLAEGTLNLNHLLKNDEKRKYLNALEKKDVLPTAHDDLDTPVDFESGEPIPSSETSPETKPKKKSSSKNRKTLIRPEDGQDLTSQEHTKRAMDIWNELQSGLRFPSHENAISVLFRVLLELSVDNYIKRKKVEINISKSQPLNYRFRKCVEHMEGQNEIDTDYKKVLLMLTSDSDVLSVETLHKYIHSKHQFPSPGDLKSKWDRLSNFIVNCLKA